MGFWFAAENLYGIPEREDTLLLQETDIEGYSPYDMFAADVPGHPANNP